MLKQKNKLSVSSDSLPVMESLESRQMMSTTEVRQIFASPAKPVFSYTSVGFRLNPLATFHGAAVGGGVDTNKDDYAVKVYWGDGQISTSRDKEVDFTLSPDHVNFLVKGSHIYNQTRDRKIVVFIFARFVRQNVEVPAFVNDMPDSGSLPVSAPEPVGTRRPLGAVQLSRTGVNQINASANKELKNIRLGTVIGKYNKFFDRNRNDYFVQINWGDDGSWTPGVVLGPTTAWDAKMRFFGTHTYTKPGRHTIVVYITGPDGQTTTLVAATVLVV